MVLHFNPIFGHYLILKFSYIHIYKQINKENNKFTSFYLYLEELNNRETFLRSLDKHRSIAQRDKTRAAEEHECESYQV